MTIARRRGGPIDTTSAIAPANPSIAPSPFPVGVPLPVHDVPPPDQTIPVGHLRRCTFRRIDRVAALPQRNEPPIYETMCLYYDREAPLPLGDVDEARPVCDACTATGIFRPDED